MKELLANFSSLTGPRSFYILFLRATHFVDLLLLLILLLWSDEKLISIARGGTHKVMDSLTVVYGIIAQRSPSFQSVLKAALLGGDTDSNASMGK